MAKPSNLERLIDEYMRENSIGAGYIQTFRNRHHSICDRYGTKDYTQCDCLSVPKLTLGGMDGLKMHEVFDPESGGVGYIIELPGNSLQDDRRSALACGTESKSVNQGR